VIKASSGLSDEEVARMVSDAEAHAEDDQKFQEFVEVRNQADAMVHSTEKSLEDLGEQVDAEERAKIETAVADVKEALKGDDKDVLETKTKALGEAAAPMAQKAYEKAAAEAGAEAGAGDAGASEDDSVVDAEFEEVKDDDQKSA
jgi:molecular chaperone DnaK